MRHLAGIAELFDCGSGIAAANDGRALALGTGRRNPLGPLGKRGELKHAHGAVPDDGLGRNDNFGKELDALRPNIQTHPVCRHLVRIHNLMLGVRAVGAGNDVVHRQQQLHAARLRLCH
ncbi:hypothetical protein SDC9_152736 [bioreactor metagenome]|uniref:Uncharacterized protein n=1 Tax=bioreactor metagenome TaxID=1076179 RepID=A0A645ETX5_9ZZZZ